MADRINMSEAMETLRGMFSNVDTDVISTILESTAGDMTAAVDQLLMIQPDDTDTNTSKEEENSKNATQTTLRKQPPIKSSNSTITTSTNDQQWKYPLPNDFLQLPQNTHQPRHSSRHGSDDVTPGDIMTDEDMMKMLEEPGFLEQLRQDPTFAAYLQAEAAYLRRAERHSQHTTNSMSVAEILEQRRSSQKSQSDTWESVKKGFSTMGTEMRNRFHALAAKMRRSHGDRSHSAQYSTLNQDDVEEVDGVGNVTVRLDRLRGISGPDNVSTNSAISSTRGEAIAAAASSTSSPAKPPSSPTKPPSSAKKSSHQKKSGHQYGSLHDDDDDEQNDEQVDLLASNNQSATFSGASTASTHGAVYSNKSNNSNYVREDTDSLL